MNIHDIEDWIGWCLVGLALMLVFAALLWLSR